MATLSTDQAYNTLLIQVKNNFDKNGFDYLGGLCQELMNRQFPLGISQKLTSTELTNAFNSLRKLAKERFNKTCPKTLSLFLKSITIAEKKLLA